MVFLSCNRKCQQNYGRSKWQEFCLIYRHLNRKGELKRLIKWASTNNYRGPMRLYQNHLTDVDRVLLRYRIDCPRLMKWAYALNMLSTVIRSTPRYRAKGSASKYRYKIQVDQVQIYGV